MRGNISAAGGGWRTWLCKGIGALEAGRGFIRPAPALPLSYAGIDLNLGTPDNYVSALTTALARGDRGIAERAHRLVFEGMAVPACTLVCAGTVPIARAAL